MLNKMRFFRFIRNMTQDKLMAETGIDQSRISRIERSIIKPTAKEREKLSLALGTTPEELFPEN